MPGSRGGNRALHRMVLRGKVIQHDQILVSGGAQAPIRHQIQFIIQEPGRFIQAGIL